MGIALQKSGNGILLFLCIGIPNLLPAHPETDYQRTGFHRLLECPERILMLCNLLLVSVGSHIKGV